MGCCTPQANGVPPVVLLHTMVNVGGFAEVYRNGTGPQPFELRSWQSSDASVSISQAALSLDMTVIPGGAGADVFQTDSTATRTSNSTTPTVMATLTGTAKMLEGEEWKVNMDVAIAIPTASFSGNAEQIWEIETSAGVFAEFDRYSLSESLVLAGNEKAWPQHRTKNLVASMDAPRIRLAVHRTVAGAGSVFWEDPSWGGFQIEETP